MFWANTSAGNYPIMNYNFTSDILQTDSSGIAFKEFPYLSSDTAFTFIVKASTAGINGIGYLSQETVTNAGSLIPYIQSYDNGTANVSLTQNPQTGMGSLYFNASFYALPDNFVPIPAGTFAGSVDSTAPSRNLQYHHEQSNWLPGYRLWRRKQIRHGDHPSWSQLDRSARDLRCQPLWKKLGCHGLAPSPHWRHRVSSETLSLESARLRGDRLR